MGVAKNGTMANMLSKIPGNNITVVDLGCNDGKCDGEEEEICTCDVSKKRLPSLSLFPPPPPVNCTLSGLFLLSGGGIGGGGVCEA